MLYCKALKMIYQFDLQAANRWQIDNTLSKLYFVARNQELRAMEDLEKAQMSVNVKA